MTDSVDTEALLKLARDAKKRSSLTSECPRCHGEQSPFFSCGFCGGSGKIAMTYPREVALANGIEALAEENARLRDALSDETVLRESFQGAHGAMTEHACALEAERDEARGWVRRLTATERVLTCAFCGESYPPGTPGSNHEALTAHVMVCVKHPMRAVEAENARMRQLIVDYQDGKNRSVFRRKAEEFRK